MRARVLAMANGPDGAGGPLQGLTVVVTRAAAQQAELAGALRAAGATVVALATIAIAPPADGGAALAAAISRLGEYHWVVLTSTNGARAFLDALPDPALAAGVRFAAVGRSTAEVLTRAGLPVDLVPDEFVGEALLDAFPSPSVEDSRRVLLVRAAVGRDVVPDGLRAAGWEPDIVGAYQTVWGEVDEAAVAAAGTADVVLFASPSSVRRFQELIAGDTRPQSPEQAPSPTTQPIRSSRPTRPGRPTRPTLPAIVIGAVTEAAARAAGFEVVRVARRSDSAGLVDAVIEWAAEHRPR